MSKSTGPRKEIPSARRSGAKHVIVDGSNLATEGRTRPSLTQLNEAVLAFMEEHPKSVITVIVDATFGHRIDPKEVASFDKAVEHNELVTPPAGTVGRGDAFVLNIAEKVGASILSNDSYQEFHGQYPWLFDEGRLIGGKPVPNIGWVFVERVPVRGDKSRRAILNAKSEGDDAQSSVKKPRAKASAAAMKPMPIPKSPPPGATLRAKEPEKTRPDKSKSLNDILPFLQFVEKFPVGSEVSGQVESYSSHGAYIELGDVRGYVPLRLLGNPPPRSAREVMTLGEQMSFEVVEIIAGRRSINVRPIAAGSIAATKVGAKKSAVKESPKKKIAVKKTPVKKTQVKETPVKKKQVKKTATPKTVAAKDSVLKKTSTKAPVKVPATKGVVAKSATKKAVVKKAPAKKTAAKKAPVKKTAAKKTPVKKAK